LLAILTFMVDVQAKDECSSLPVISNKQTLVGWVTNERTTSQWSAETNETTTTSLGSFRVVAVIEDGKIKETIGSSLKNGQKFWPIDNANTPVSLTSVNGFLDHMNYDHCVYYASISNNKYTLWTLFTSKQDERFKTPNKSEIELFYKLNTTCVNQGDYPVGKEPPCTKAKLLAITDVNNDKKPEYWATQPYMWDDGLTVWEYNGQELTRLLEVCVGCSD